MVTINPTCCSSLRQNITFVTYVCILLLSIIVFWPRKNQCRGSDFARPTASSGYLASTVTDETGCGSAETPWMISVPKGQKINITLHDFSAIMIAMNASSRTVKIRQHCHVLAIIKVSAFVKINMKQRHL